MKDHELISDGARGCLINLVNLFLATCAVILSAAFQYPDHPSCRGGLGAGFPRLFICDAGVGGSPISSWGRIDFADLLNGGIRPGGFLVNFLFYTALIWIIWILVAGMFPQRLTRRDLGWAAGITIVYVAGFLCASLVFFSSELYDKNYARTPTPFTTSMPTATSPGTPPSPDTANPTTGP
jgi:hypothetical protein